MRNSLFLLASVSAAVSAGVPNVFRPNDPAKADQVNANFHHLDSAVGAKTDTAALSARLSGYATTNSLVNYATVGALVSGLGGKADTAALSAVKASIPVGVNIGGKVDTAALTVRLSGYAPASALANYATTSSLAGFATSAALTAGLGGKADTAALSAVKASIPAGVNIGGKVDTAALTTRLSNYALNSALAAYAKTTDLSTYAKATDLASYAPLTSLANYAKTTDLAAYAKATDLSAYAKTTALAPYATTASLANYATTASVAGKMNTADYVASGHLKALGGITGGRGMSGLFVGSSMVLDTNELRMENAGNFTLLNNTSLAWRQEYSGWEFRVGDDFRILRNTLSFDITGLILTDFKAEFPNQVAIGGDFTVSGGAQFAGNVAIDGTLKVAGTTMNVPDYVFESDYKLAPLAEVEAYTQANKHLPEVPSAKEIQAGGLDLAQMNLTLLRKVEELTLHAIAQEKQLKAQNERIQSLESRLAN